MGQIMFSVVVVCLNAGDSLRTTVESIRMQTYGNYEIIVKDGLSKDGSLEKLPQDERIRVYRREDSGIYDAMNQAVEKAKGDYVYFLNCGDVFYDNVVLQKVAVYIEEYRTRLRKPEESENSRIILYGDIFERITGERVSSNPRMDAFGCYRNVPCHQACFYALGLMKRKRFEVKYRVRADYEHFLWCFFEGNAKMLYMPFLIADYEGGGFSETKKNRKRSGAEHKEIVKKYMSRGQIFRYRLIMAVSLAPVRTWIARNRVTARLYNGLKEALYKFRGC